MHNRKSAKLGDVPRCAVKDGINHPINITRNTDLRYISDVASSFKTLFNMGLVLNFAIAFHALTVCFGARTCVKWTKPVGIVTKTLDAVFLFAVTGLRWSHAGMVCSGDYLYKPVTIDAK